MFALQGKYKKNLTNKVRSLPVARSVDGSNALLYEPMVNFSAQFYCWAADKIAAFCYTNSLSPSVRASVRDNKSELCENGQKLRDRPGSG